MQVKSSFDPANHDKFYLYCWSLISIYNNSEVESSKNQCKEANLQYKYPFL